MALVSSTLVDGLRELFEDRENPPADAQEAGKRWAAAYSEYAGGATALATTPLKPALTAATQTLGGLLGSAFKLGAEAGPAGIATVTPLMDVAFVSFWMTPPLAFSAGPAAGVVTLASPGVLTSGLAAAFAAGIATPSATAAQQAAVIGGVLDVWTRTITVTVAPPGPPPVPIL